MPGTGRLEALSTICLIASGSPPLPPPELSGRLLRSHYSKSSRNISHFVTPHIIIHRLKVTAELYSLTYLNKNSDNIKTEIIEVNFDKPVLEQMSSMTRPVSSVSEVPRHKNLIFSKYWLFEIREHKSPHLANVRPGFVCDGGICDVSYCKHEQTQYNN